MDLRNQMGRVQDHPVDGILGMSYLRGTRFLLDPARRRLVWWGTHTGPGLALPITEGPGGVSYATLRLGKRDVQAMLDTGMSGGVDLPSDLRPGGDGTAMVSGGLSGAQVSGAQVMVDRLDAGPGAWEHLPVTFQPGDKTGSIGSGVWFAAPVCFDFISDLVTLSLDPDGHLPIRREPSRNLPILWDRSGARPQLVVALVKPGSALERAGCQAGDILIQAGGLRGPALTRRAVQDLVASGVPHTWVVRRRGNEVRLAFGTR